MLSKAEPSNVRNHRVKQGEAQLTQLFRDTLTPDTRKIRQDATDTERKPNGRVVVLPLTRCAVGGGGPLGGGCTATHCKIWVGKTPGE